jgi:hypothetical protein
MKEHGVNWFRPTWDEINGHRPGRSWADNPHVWAYSWERVLSAAEADEGLAEGKQ